MKCAKSLNILKVLSHQSWGSDRLCLLRIYRSVVRSRLDYGSFVYGSAKASVLKMLDPIHNQGLRLSVGAFRTSPVPSLYAEANEVSLEKRRFALGFMYSLRVRSVPLHPAHDPVVKIRFQRTFQNKPSFVPPFALRNTTAAELFGLEPKPCVTQHRNTVAPWDYSLIYCDFTLTKHCKKDTPDEVLRQEFFELQSHYQHHTSLYTDGTKTEAFVDCAMIGPSVCKTKRLNPFATILTAELHGLLLAVEYIIEKKLRHSVVYTDF